MDSSSSASSPQTVEQISEVVSMLDIPSEAKILPKHTVMALIKNSLSDKDNKAFSKESSQNLKGIPDEIEGEAEVVVKKQKKDKSKSITVQTENPLKPDSAPPTAPRPRGRPRKYPRPDEPYKPASPSLVVKKKLLSKKGKLVASQKKLPEPKFKKFNLIADMGIKEGQYSEFLYLEPFERPEGHYLRATESIPDSKCLVEYDLDLEDKAWLEKLNKWFELSRKNAIPTLSSSLNNVDVPCDICGEIDCENSNAIVFCDGCDLAVHQDCYGVPYIPEGQWLCRKCMLSPANPVECVFCPNEGGAFKQTSTNNWAHLTCALWIPEVSFGNTVYMEPIEGIGRVPKSRMKLLCYICKQPSGACIQCSFKSCPHPFHPTCARAAKLYMRYKATEEGVSMKVFCHKHTPKGYKHEINIEETQAKFVQKHATRKKERQCTSDSDSEREAVSKSARAHNQSFWTSEAIIPRHIFQKVLKSLAKFKIRKPSHFLTEVCKYWSLKKEDCRNAPLIKRLHLEPWTALPTALQTEEEKLRVYGTLKKVRSDLERVRMLIDLVRKREACKLNIARAKFQYWETNFFPQVRYFRVVLERLSKMDTCYYFTQPVTIEQAPDYLQYIKNPMDLGTLSKLINTHQVVTLDDFKDKVMLIYNNCMLYNSESTVYFKAAVRHKKRATNLLAIITEALKSSPALTLEEVARRFDADKCFAEACIPPPSTPPKSAKAMQPNGVKRTPEKASPPLTRSKKRYFECYDLRNKSHLKLKSYIKTRQTTLTSPSNRLKLFKKPASVTPQRISKSPNKSTTRKPVQSSMLAYITREKPKRSPRKVNPPERLSP
ncbi:hypothetical protein DSO57_1025642 [Entomophthora muscae]|uniref:Uncharacterized protein n=1 Tax=Entomophthora muscae TaxID=34485 RepID=A0ACC2RGX3_9FUNG|nr:hypothetical protein DSO57_1025642 [Entomophthora muscae]